MKKCPITNKETYDYSKNNTINYSVKISGEEVNFDFCKRCFEKIDFKRYRHVIYGLILNKKLNLNIARTIHWEAHDESDFSLKNFIEEAYYPKTPKEKLDNLLVQINKEQSEISEDIYITNFRQDDFGAKCYFQNFPETQTYLKALNQKGLIELDSFGDDFGNTYRTKITFEGFNYLVELEENGYESKNCFIAMAFKEETKQVRQAIKNALITTGFTPIIIDEENIDSDQTINDAIIAGIKKCKFCISDFSFHRNGVYFESGFALGLGKPVIYCCSKEEFSKAHFDIKPLQHIIYESEDELEKRLIDKIEAWIK